MSEYAIVRINDKLIPEFQISYNSTNNIATKRNINQWKDINVRKNQELLLIIAGNCVLTAYVTIPSKNDEIIRQSIPFALEELLANDIEDNHFSYKKCGEQLFLVSIINRAIVQSIKTSIEKHNLICHKLYSEINTVPAIEDTTTICAIDDSYVINTNGTGTTVEKSLLSSYLKQNDSATTTLYSSKNESIVQNTETRIEQINTDLLQSKVLLTNQPINLFQGEFSEDSGKKSGINPLTKIMVLSALLIASWLCINLFTLWQLSNTIDDNKAQQKALLVNLIPNITQSELKDPYAAFQSRLKSAQNSTGSTNNAGFIQSLIYLGQTLTQHPKIQILSVRKRENKLEVKLETLNVSLLNSFQSSLENNVLAMKIKTGTRESNKTGVSSIITMEKL